MKRNLLIFLVVAPLFGILLAMGNIYYKASIWKYEGPNREFTIGQGEAFSRINYRLSKEGLISSSKIFHRYCQAKGLMTKFKSGQFVIKENSNMLEVIDTLVFGVPLADKVTIPEGKNLYQIAEILDEAKISDKKEFIKWAKNEEFVKKLGIPASTVEGYLYPETYRFSKNSSPTLVISTMVDTFKREFKKIGLKHEKLNDHEVVILASIVEKETGASFERPIIAGVFHNRLKKRMRLQSDPTTIYGIWENYNGNIRKKHLLQKTPYNTYKIPALPKGPIANPGVEALEAVLKPKEHNYLYFVSKNDGTHIFSTTYKEHRKAVNDFQKNRNARRGKSWRDLKQ